MPKAEGGRGGRDSAAARELSLMLLRNFPALGRDGNKAFLVPEA
jgi:hypothetical protein